MCQCENGWHVGDRDCPHQKCARCGFFPAEIARRKELPVELDERTGLRHKTIKRKKEA